MLNLGCGSKPVAGAVNVDIVKQDGVDVVHDLDVFPWPFGDGEFTRVLATDIYEHVEHPLEFVAECWRVLAVRGLLFIHTAYWKNPLAFTDPTHRRFLTEDSFNYWIPGTRFFDVFGKAYGGHDHPFELARGWLDTPLGDLNFELRKINAATPA